MSAPKQIEGSEVEIRPFSGSPADIAALTRVRNETLRETTLPEDFRELTPEEMSRYYDRGGFKLQGSAWLMFTGGEAAGAAVIYPPAAFHDRPPGNFHLYVVPSRWRHGLGAALLRIVEEQAAAQGYPVLETTIAAEDGQSTRFLLSRGFRVVGHSHHLVRASLDGLPPVALRPGFSLVSLSELRESPQFYTETANRLGAYDPNYSLINAVDVQSQTEQGKFEPAGILFLFDPSGRIAGVIRASTSPDQRGYLNEIRLEPASRGKGLGLAMVAAGLNYLQTAGMKRAELDTAGENMAAYNLALRAGFTEARHWLHFLKRLEPHPVTGNQNPAIS